MRYKIFENGIEINTIIADEAFVKSYCEKRGYTYEEDILPEVEPAEPEVTELEQLRADVDYIAMETGVEL